MRFVIGLALAAITAAACQGGPTGPSRDRCRQYPVRFQLAGSESVFQCTLEPGPRLTCRTGVFGSRREWSYASNADFLQEGEPPFHQFRKTSFSSSGGTFAGTSTHFLQEWTYDAAKRPVREDERVSFLGGETRTERVFTAWDSAGRPTRAEQTDAGGTRALDITYSDRTMTWSDGRSATVDANGNLISETSSAGFRADYVILETARFCAP